MFERTKIAVIAAIIVAGPLSAKAEPLFTDLGGKPGIERLVSKALLIWKNDDRVASTFEDTNLARFKRMIVDQICALTGGDCQYTGRSMAEAHKALHLATVQFNAVAEDLQAAMEQLSIPYSTQNRLLALLAPMHRDIVSR